MKIKYSNQQYLARKSANDGNRSSSLILLGLSGVVRGLLETACVAAVQATIGLKKLCPAPASSLPGVAQ